MVVNKHNVKSLGSNILASYIGKTWAAMLNILVIPLYLKFMGIEAYGLVGFYVVLSSVLGIFDLGLGLTMNRELARLSSIKGSESSQRDVVRTFEIVYWGISILIGAVVAGLAPYIARFWINTHSLDPTSVLIAVKLMGVAFALQFPQALYQGGLMGLQRQVLVSAILFFTSTFRYAGVVVVLWLISPSIQAFLAWQVIVGVVGCFIYLIAMWRSLPEHEGRPRFRSSIIYDVRKYTLVVAANAFIGIILTQIDKVILSKMLTLKMFGYYSLAATVASAIWMIIIPLNTALFPRLVQLHEMKNKMELANLFHRSSQILAVMLFPVCAILVLFSQEILLLWTRDPSVVENAHIIVSLLVLGTMLNGVSSLPAYSASAFGWPQLVTYTNMIQSIVIVPLIVALVFRYQGVGAAIAWLMLNGAYIIFMVPCFFCRYLKEERKSWFLFDIAIPAVTAFSICMISSSFVPVAPGRVFMFGYLAVTWAVAFFVSLLFLKHIRGMAYYYWRTYIQG